ncbi:MAG: tRNA adenosine deaminase-associated protein [Actinomycetes bacterium]
MTYFAALLARHGEDWKGQEVDLDEVADLDTLADLLVDASDQEQPVLLLLEQEDEWFAVVRVDGDDADARVFVSDVRAAATSALGPVLLAHVIGDLAGDESAEPPVSTGPDVELLADLGLADDGLLELCADGLLPADALSAVADRAGCLDALERLR